MLAPDDWRRPLSDHEAIGFREKASGAEPRQGLALDAEARLLSDHEASIARAEGLEPRPARQDRAASAGAYSAGACSSSSGGFGNRPEILRLNVSM